MNHRTDQELLREYIGRRSETAFTELVRRHLDLVHSAALRMVRDPHLAQDVTQAVFVALAQGARQLEGRSVLSGWLHRTAQNLAANVVRSDVRRRAREQEAAAMNELLSTETNAPWEQIAPHLDAALGELTEADRDALLLRYFERKSAHEMAQTLGVSDEAAQKRVSRAVERLREFLARRGVTIGASGLFALISAHAVQAAPVGLGAVVAGAALAAATLAPATLLTMNWLNAKTAAVVLGAALFAGTGVHLVQQHRLAHADEASRALAAQQQQLTAERDEALAAALARTQEAEALRNDLRELPRLRGEVARLRDATPPGAVPPGQRTPRVAGIIIHHVGADVPGRNPPPVINDEQVRAHLSVKIGDPYSRVAIDRDVLALYATGLFTNIRVSEEKTNANIILTYLLQDRPAPATPGQFITRDQLTFAGYATPEAAEQSLFWALVSANFDMMTNSFDATGRRDFESADARAEFEENIKTETARFQGMQIMARKVVSDDKVELKIKVDLKKSEISIQQLVRVGTEWKRHQSVGYDPAWDQKGNVQNYTP